MIGPVIRTDNEGYAISGAWHRAYLAAWTRAFPSSKLTPGRFYEADKWASSTPAWDSWWFESYGVRPPRKRLYLDPARQ